ncbi:MAG: hemin receptor, partial [Alphaproteobacteria bacterium]|nr:hemin receptor [Alphaproteobacteria bacterium]
MTPQHIELVQSSFKKVVPIAGAAADLFYDRLFEIAPDVRPLFPQDLTEQKKKLMDMLGTAVDSLHKLDTILPAVQALGW